MAGNGSGGVVGEVLHRRLVGTVVRQFPGAVRAASWDSVVLDVGEPSLRRIPLRDPWRGTQAHVGELLRECPDARALVDRLASG